MKKKNTTITFPSLEYRPSNRLLLPVNIFHFSVSIPSLPLILSYAKKMEPEWKINFTLLQ